MLFAHKLATITTLINKVQGLNPIQQTINFVPKVIYFCSLFIMVILKMPPYNFYIRLKLTDQDWPLIIFVSRDLRDFE